VFAFMKGRGTYSGRHALRSSSSSAESWPTGWIFSTPLAYEDDKVISVSPS
jgi:hypothetical protein